MTELRGRLEDYQKKVHRKKVRRAKWENWKKTQAMFYCKTSTNYNKWDMFESDEESEDEEEDEEDEDGNWGGAPSRREESARNESADEEDEDPNLANLDPKQREAMKAKVKNMESMLQAMRAGDSASVSARLAGGAVGEAPAVRDHDDPAIAALIAEPAVKALLDRCVVGHPRLRGRPSRASSAD